MAESASHVVPNVANNSSQNDNNGVKRALIAKNKEGFITGFLPKPDVSDKNFHKWTRADYMVMSWILSSISPTIADDFAYVTNSNDLWQELNERFGQSNGPLIYQLKKEIDGLRQENLTIIAYYGLNSGFDSTVTNIMAMEPLPTINGAFSITQQIEKHKEISGVMDVGESSAMAAQRYNLGGGGGIGTGNLRFQGKRDWKKEKFDKKCDHCKGTSHTIDQCFKLIGYPEWYNALKSTRGGISSSKNKGRKFAANVHVNYEIAQADSPLASEEISSGNAGGHVDSEMLSSIC
ncbi:uncharacterized protein LOC109134455 [Beta vulgaris subsp. vulgaris]|uniref:uncharacterized protein LOC109134455 n=1 Tax=Beta vulgaris subsp. vulgaris TaxID=3555 RepID=UPI002036727A|nr:uncharacterized protein LOC109134455 [Beta vulgaris subsp. vulgaris]